MTEIWMPVKGYEGLYEVSNTGKVRSLNYRHTGKIKELSPGVESRGYLHVILCKEGKCKHFSIHRLVVESFICEIPKCFVVNHKDENKLNNNIENLEICTQKYNVNYSTYGKKRSPETCAKISAARKGKKHSLETRAKISTAMKGKKGTV